MELFRVEREDWDYDEETEWVVMASSAAQAKKFVRARLERKRDERAEGAQLFARRLRAVPGVLFASVHHG